jgi:hypothetical protein
MIEDMNRRIKEINMIEDMNRRCALILSAVDGLSTFEATGVLKAFVTYFTTNIPAKD